jgi:hypothetical protein
LVRAARLSVGLSCGGFANEVSNKFSLLPMDQAALG